MRDYFWLLLFTTLLINIPAGYYRENFKKMSLNWWLVLHSPVPVIFILRHWMGFEYKVIPVLIIIAVIGQLIGGRLLRKYIKGLAKRN